MLIETNFVLPMTHSKPAYSRIASSLSSIIHIGSRFANIFGYLSKKNEIFRFEILNRNDVAKTESGNRCSTIMDTIDLVLTLDKLRKSRHLKKSIITMRANNLSIAESLDINQEIELCNSINCTIIGFTEYFNIPNLVALAHCKKRYAPPLSGPLQIPIQMRYYQLKGLLDIVGIKVITISSGEMKSGILNFGDSETSETILNNAQSVVKYIQEYLLSILAHGLKNVNSGKELKDVLSEISTASHAVTKGILSGVTYPEYMTRIGRLIFGDDQRFFWPESVVQRKPSIRGKVNKFITQKPLILLEIDGFLMGQQSTLLNRIVQIENRADYAGLLVIVDSHGGDLTIVDRMWCLLDSIKRKKPIVAYIRSATSGGYYIASAATRIVTNPCAEIGSIGSLLFRTDFSELLSKLGVGVKTVGYDNNERIGDLIESPGETEMRNLRSRINLASALFIERIATSRNLSEDKVKKIADGRLLSSQQALELGLIDNIGCLLDALNVLYDLSGCRTSARIIRLSTTKAESYSLQNLIEILSSSIQNIYAVSSTVNIL